MPFEIFPFLVPGLRDIIEILIVAFVIYQLLLFLAGTRALQILLGLLSLVVVYFVAVLLKLQMITTLMGLILPFGAFAAVVVFQPELRHALAQLGRTRAIKFFTSASQMAMADEMAEAVSRLSRNGTGAIIAIEGEVSLSDYVETGSVMDAKVSADLLTTIFTPYSPLHDGAVIVRGDKIVAAGCVLPLTQFPVNDRSLGTRHRAALGLSEETDATVLVVSEETSKISIAIRGMLRRSVTADQVRQTLAGDRPAISLSDATSETSAA